MRCLRLLSLALVMHASAAFGRGIEEFDGDTPGLWAFEPQRIEAAAGWTNVPRNGERALCNTPDPAGKTEIWRLVRQYHLAGVADPRLQLKYELAAVGYDGFEIRVGTLGDPLKTVRSIAAPSAGAQELSVDLAEWAESDITIELVLHRPAAPPSEPGLYVYRIGIDLPEVERRSLQEASDFSHGFGPWVPSPERIGRANTAGWSFVEAAGRKSIARAEPSPTARPYYWKLVREVDLTAPVVGATLEVTFDFLGEGYEAFEIGIGDRSASALRDFRTVFHRDQATPGPMTARVDLAPYLGSPIRLQLLLQKKGGVVAQQSGLAIERADLSYVISEQSVQVESDAATSYESLADLVRGASLVVRGRVAERSPTLPFHGLDRSGHPVLTSPPLHLSEVRFAVSKVLAGQGAGAGEVLSILEPADEVEGVPIATGTLSLRQGAEFVLFLTRLRLPGNGHPTYGVIGLGRGVFTVEPEGDGPPRVASALRRIGEVPTVFSLLRQSLDRMEAEGLPVSARRRLSALEGAELGSETALRAAASQALGSAAALRYGDALVRAAHRSSREPFGTWDDVAAFEGEIQDLGKPERKQP